MIKGKYLFLLILYFSFILTLSLAATPKSRNLELDCEVQVDDIPAGASIFKLWFPQPPQTPYQEVRILSIAPKNSQSAFDRDYHNKIIFYSLKSPRSSLRFNVKYKIRRYEYSKSNSHSAKIKQEENLSKYLISNRLMLVSDELRQMAAGITKGKNTAIQKARAIYDYVLNTVSYDKTIPGWGEGDTLRVCILKAGNCTDFHSLFVSLARASNIPAKFVIGIPLPKENEGEVVSYHCWAEFYDEKSGWAPVDVSEAWRDKTKSDYYFGNINEDRVELSQGRDIVLEPQCRGEPLNYFFYPYAEVDGKTFKNVKVIFHYKDLSIGKEVLGLTF